MKGEIVTIQRFWDDAMCKFFYQCTIDFEKKPDLELGECEIKSSSNATKREK